MQTDQAILPFRAPVEEKLLIRGMVFGGFAKCLYPAQKFDSDPERRFAIILEDETSVLKWLKPPKETLRFTTTKRRLTSPISWLRQRPLDTFASRSGRVR